MFRTKLVQTYNFNYGTRAIALVGIENVSDSSLMWYFHYEEADLHFARLLLHVTLFEI